MAGKMTAHITTFWTGSWASVLIFLLCGIGCQQPDAPVDVPSSAVVESVIATSTEPAEIWMELKPGLRISQSARSVMFEAEICLDEGWLEQLVCSVGSREHESILVTTIPASSIHAALLAVGLSPGQPGQWVDGFVPPHGSVVEIQVGVAGHIPEVPLREWVTNVDGSMPLQPWVFAGSRMRESHEVPEGYSRYEADTSGSIVGLVTFGDELLGYQEVIPDQVEVAPEEWKARTDSIPPVGTKVWVLISPIRD